MPDATLNRFADVHEALCHPQLRQCLYDAGEIIMKDVLLTLHGEAHKTRRHLELRLFRRNFARLYETEVFPATLASILDPLVRRGEADLVDFGYRVTMNLTADFAGIDREGTAEETSTLLDIVRRFSEGATLVHSQRDHGDVIKEVIEAQAAFESFLTPSWRRRQALLNDFDAGRLNESDLPRDVLTVLLRNQDNIELSDEVIAREIAFYLQAGSHSTANSMVHAVHEIFCFAAQPVQLLEQPLLLQRCVHESMRLHPASPVAWRTPVQPVTLKNGLDLHPGELLILDIESANRDSSVFGRDPDCFDPARVVTHPRAAAYGLTFGTGVHMCTGRDLDGGVASTEETDPATHQYGIVCKLVSTLLEKGMKPHPAHEPVKDAGTSRNNWGSYPVQLGPLSQ